MMKGNAIIFGDSRMRTVALTILMALPLAAAGHDKPAKPAKVDATIERGLGFLAKDALAWKKEHNCVSCHHAGLVMWAMREAKQYKHAVDETVLADLTKWVAESGDGKTSVPRPKGIPKALNAKAVWLTLALSADQKPDDAARKGMGAMLKTVQADQLDNGAWASWPETRPPIFGNSDESMTALATLALLAGADDDAKASRDKGVKWLTDTKSDDDAQSVAMRLVLWSRLGKPEKEIAALAERVKSRQNKDGGWSQTKEMASDAWATGQALYALAHAGLRSKEETVASGHAFLIKTQRDDGSWPMTSRPTKPGGDGSTGLVPITGAGSSWAVIGLVRSK